ncbi:hypothetical protein L9F63_017014, partial [Diploptera punctata]
YPTNFRQFRLIFLRHKIVDCRSGRRTSGWQSEMRTRGERCLTGETPLGVIQLPLLVKPAYRLRNLEDTALNWFVFSLHLHSQ